MIEALLRNSILVSISQTKQLQNCQLNAHNPSIVFRHLAARKKDVVNQCLEFAELHNSLQM